MDERTERRVLQKMEYVQEAAAELATIRDSTDCQEYERDRRTRDVVEREFQTAIEACIDIGEMVLSDRGVSVPDSNAGVFRALGECGVLDETVTSRMVRAAKFRNVLAHRYGPDIDDEDVYSSLRDDLDLFTAYLREIRALFDEESAGQ